MRAQYYLLDADLSLFDGASASGDGSTSAGDAGLQQGDNTIGSAQTDPPADTRADDEGKTPDEDRRKAYEELIKGEYKDFYTQDTQKMIDRRFRETKNLEKQLAENADIMEMLYQRYGVNDSSELAAAIEGDDGYWEQAAFDAGMSVDQFKAYSKLERQNKMLLQAQAEQQKQEAVQRKLDQWNREAADLKQKFSGFDLEREVTSSPEFTRLLQANVPMEHAYRLLHMDEIMNNAIATSAAAAERRTVDNIRARGQRPAENGTSSQSSFNMKDDVNSLSKKDRAEIVRRAARGEVITF